MSWHRTAVLRPYKNQVRGLAGDARADTFHHLQDFLKGDHRSVAGGGHGEGAVGGAAFYGPLRILPGEETVNETAGEGIAAANAVENFQAFAVRGLIELAIVVADGAPIIQRSCCALAPRGGNDLERIILNN